MKYALALIYIIIFLIIIFTLFSPILIAVITNNWWFILLFTVSWIPAVIEILLLALVVNVFDDHTHLF